MNSISFSHLAPALLRQARNRRVPDPAASPPLLADAPRTHRTLHTILSTWSAQLADADSQLHAHHHRLEALVHTIVAEDAALARALDANLDGSSTPVAGIRP
ncbi:hypothetical protein G7Y31_10705 [Corynebacterium lizhenjunii]|uniref:Uncharacterized protein n=1 Tax=Corynebacterium lizhenjunii TaxID=2709394 RepID=A0A7T0KFX1_9CORY|nr:hypothetical protein [Corynebacterium lizhenjunii]QPK78963.1 hypothetical protein G7Y31_10705 [Corynebacterium lizhenjunii]